MHDRRLVRVLDVVDTADHLGIVTEWVNGDSWTELLTERWSPQEAAIVALEVGRALESAHATGVTHGRIRPDSVMVTDTREVRLRGLGVDAVLWGVEPVGDPWRADLNGVGALLYAGLTKRWPGSERVVGLRPAPVLHGHTQAPSALVPDIDGELDRIIARSLVMARTPDGTEDYTSVGECVHALEDVMSQLGSADGQAHRAQDAQNATDRLLGRLGTVAVVVLAMAGMGLLLWQLTIGRSDVASSDAAAVASAFEPLSTPQPPIPEGPFPIVAARDFDPDGDGRENPKQVKLAYDGDKSTAWRTQSYPTSEPDGSAGVGVVFDLGAVRPVRAIDLKLAGAGADFKIATTTESKARSAKFRTVVDITGAGDKINVRTPRAINARFVLVKLTRLPFDGQSYSGGLREVTILG